MIPVVVFEMLSDQALLKCAGFQEMLAWYTNLSPRERNTFWACCGGWALDAMDIQLYTFLMPTRRSPTKA